MMEMIITGIISGLMGYIFPQPKWAAMLQEVLWAWLQKKFKELVTK